MVEIRLPLTAGGAVDLSQREAVAAVEQA